MHIFGCILKFYSVRFSLYKLMLAPAFFATGYLLLPVDASGQADTLKHAENQHNIYATDTSLSQKDKARYDRLMQSAAKSKWKKALYSTFINNLNNETAEQSSGSTETEYKPYEERNIEQINIVILKPFGTNIHSPDSLFIDGVNKTLNQLHISTRQSIVRNNLLFKEGEKVRAITIAESEAFLRNTGYIRDARILIDSVPGSQAAIVTVIAADVWSIGFDINNASLTQLDVKVFDKNFLGLGNEIFIRGIHARDYSRHFGYGIGYKYTNFLHTFINLHAEYTDAITSTNSTFSAERALETSLHYFGQASYTRFNQRLEFAPWDSISPPQQESMSVSFGRSFHIFSAPSANRFVLAGRYMFNAPSYSRTTYRPYPLQYQYTRNQSLLFQFTLYQQRYYRQYLIHSFGITENIPHGYNISAQVGYNRIPGYFEGLYTSLSLSAGKQFTFGNVYANAAIASHFNTKGNAYQGIRKFHLRYYTPLARIGQQRLRSFVNLSYAAITNPLSGLVNYIYLNTASNLQMTDSSPKSKGTERLMLDVENDLFTNLHLIGFRFVFFSFADIGWIKETDRLIKEENLVWGIGLGVRIRNELLVFQTIEIKFGYYPLLNQVKANDFININTFSPRVQPTFIPGYPQEIILQ